MDLSDACPVSPEQLLRATAAFSGASPLARVELVAAARMRVVEAGEYLFRCGDPSDAVYVSVGGLLASCLTGARALRDYIGCLYAGMTARPMSPPNNVIVGLDSPIPSPGATRT